MGAAWLHACAQAHGCMHVHGWCMAACICTGGAWLHACARVVHDGCMHVHGWCMMAACICTCFCVCIHEHVHARTHVKQHICMCMPLSMHAFRAAVCTPVYVWEGVVCLHVSHACTDGLYRVLGFRATQHMYVQMAAGSFLSTYP